MTNKPDPLWEEAIDLNRQELELTATEDRSGRASALYQLAYCLHNKPDPQWDEAIDLYRQELDLRTEAEDRSGRATTLFQLAYCLHFKPELDWEQAIVSSRRSLEIRRELTDVQNLISSMSQLTWLLTDNPDAQWDEAIDLYRQVMALATDMGVRVNEMAGLILCLDRVGNFGEGDQWAEEMGRLLIASDTIPEEPLIMRRKAYLALRRNDLDTVFAIAGSLSGTLEEVRAALLSSVALFASARNQDAQATLMRANSTGEDVAWIKNIAIGYFSRWAPSQGQQFVEMVDAIRGGSQTI